jgi:hypothetical protein
MDRLDPNRRDNQRRSRHEKPYVCLGPVRDLLLRAVAAQPLGSARRYLDAITIEAVASPEATRPARNCGHGKFSRGAP